MATTLPGFIVVRGVCPTQKGLCNFIISQSRLRNFAKYGPAHKFFEALSIRYVLENPSVIFRGLERQGQEGGYCYCGVPPQWRVNENTTVPFPRGMTFAVFTTSKLQIFEWGLEKAKDGWSLKSETRFEKKIWTR
jgi:hypothetical protein